MRTSSRLAGPRGPKGRSVTIREALADRQLFGVSAPFRDLSSWRRWLVFLRADYGLPMTEEDLAIFHEHTGRMTPLTGGCPEAVVGRQSGKTRIAATIAAFEAMTAAADADRTLRAVSPPLRAR